MSDNQPFEIINQTEEKPDEDSRSEFERELENYLPTPENTDKIKGSLPSWVICSIASACVCTLFLVIYSLAVVPHLKPTAVITYTQSDNKTDNNDQDAASDKTIYETAMESIVSVTATSSYHSFFGLSTSATLGSGVVISAEGHILTSCSLTGDGNDVKVTTKDGKEYNASVVGCDANKDIAILKIDATELKPAVLGNSENVHPGDISIAVGNFLGNNLGVSVTRGIICGTNYGVGLQNGGSINLIQTDAAINSGSVGGCLLNQEGEVIGMITGAISSNSDKISFAIPSNDIKNIAESLINTGLAPAGLIIGITGSDTEHGVTVESVGTDTPAEKAGIKKGDLILKIDGETVKSISDINKIRDRHKKGDKLVITVYRDGEVNDIEVEL